MEQAENAVPDKINLREHRTDGNVPPALSLESLKGPEGTDQSQGLLRVTPTWDSTAPGMGILKKKKQKTPHKSDSSRSERKTTEIMTRKSFPWKWRKVSQVSKGISASQEGQNQQEGSKAEQLVTVEQLKGGNGKPGGTRKEQKQKSPGKAEGCSAE